MIIGIGIDMVKVARIERALRQKGLKEQVFTPDEIAYCERKGAHSSESYAARFAAKEALGKALGTGIHRSELLDAEILVDERTGCPQLHLMGKLRAAALLRHVERVHVSISHTAGNAVAEVLLEE